MEWILVGSALVWFVIFLAMWRGAGSEYDGPDEPWLDWDGEVPFDLPSGGEKLDVPRDAIAMKVQLKGDEE